MRSRPPVPPHKRPLRIGVSGAGDESDPDWEAIRAAAEAVGEAVARAEAIL